MSAQGNSGQLAFALANEDKASFDNFWSQKNVELVTALKTVSDASEHRMLYLYGPSGSGKSHLLFACVKAGQNQLKRISYLSLADHYASPPMLETVDTDGLVCLDNAHCWAGDTEKERALFAIYERVKQAGGQLVVSAKQAPDLSGFTIKDLISRLSSGLIYPVHELSDDDRLQALKMRAELRGLIISNDVLKYLVTHASRDTTELFALLTKIDQASLIEKRKITIPFLQQLLN